MTKNVRIALIQSSPFHMKDPLEESLNLVTEAARNGAQIICLPELFSSSYFCMEQKVELFDLAQPVTGPIISSLQLLAAKLRVVIIAPFFEKRDAGIYHNSAGVIDADGQLLGVYRKMHIPDDPLYFEKFYFTPGDSSTEAKGYMSFKTRFARIGVLICWDQWYPEAARITSLLGAQVLFYPTAIGWQTAKQTDPSDKELQAWLNIQRGHAIANGVFVAAANRVGVESIQSGQSLRFWGNSFIVDPFGETLVQAQSDDTCIIAQDCDLSEVERIRRLWPFLRDRRIDSYQAIVSRYLAKNNGD